MVPVVNTERKYLVRLWKVTRLKVIPILKSNFLLHGIKNCVNSLKGE